MLPTRLAIAGAIALTLGLITMGFGLSPTEKAAAGNGGCAPFGGTGFTTASPPAETPTCTPTQQITNRTATPTAADDTATATAAADTATTQPATQVPATATSPAGGAGAGGLQPPDTGTGETSAQPTWVFGVGLVVALAGVAALLGGMRRKRA